MRLLGSRRQAPPEYIPLIDPEPLTNFPPMDECPLEYISAFVFSDQVLVERLSTASPLDPQLWCRKPTPSQAPAALPYSARIPMVWPAAEVGQCGSCWAMPLMVFFKTSMSLCCEGS